MGTSVNAKIAGLPETSFLAQTTAKVMVTGDTIFTITGDIKILSLYSRCVTVNNGTASTLQYQVNPTAGTITTITGASASLASCAANSLVILNGTALSTAPDLVVENVGLMNVSTRGILVPAGTIKTVIAVGSTTGTWQHFIEYTPLNVGATVYSAF